MRINFCVTVVLVCVLAAPMANAREWQDASGRFSIEAEFVEYKDRQVVLKRTSDGKIIKVSVDKLSAKDRRYIAGKIRTPSAKSKPTKGKKTGEAKSSGLFTNSVGMKLKLISPGRVEPDEGKPVEISQPFYIGIHEVTQKQWGDLIGTKPWRYQDLLDKTDKKLLAPYVDPDVSQVTPDKRARLVTDPRATELFQKLGVGNILPGQENRESPTIPVSHVSWKEAALYCVRLSKKENKVYRLPTKEEWEYACRAGAKAKYSFGTGYLVEHAWYSKTALDKVANGARYPLDSVWELRLKVTGGPVNKSPLPVGLLKPNAWGLYDMHGNVAEYVDHFPKGREVGNFVATHGGSIFSNDSTNDPTTTCSHSDMVAIDRYTRPHTGFRVVMEPDRKPSSKFGDLPLGLRSRINMEWRLNKKLHHGSGVLRKLDGESVVLGQPRRRGDPIEKSADTKIPLSALRQQDREYIELLVNTLSKD